MNVYGNGGYWHVEPPEPIERSGFVQANLLECP